MNAIFLMNRQEGVCFGYACSKCKEVYRGKKSKEEADGCCTDIDVCKCGKRVVLIDNPFFGFVYDLEEEYDLEFDFVNYKRLCEKCFSKAKSEIIKYYEYLYQEIGKKRGDKFFIYDDLNNESKSELKFSTVSKLLKFSFDKKDYIPDFGIARNGKHKHKVLVEAIDSFMAELFNEKELKKERAECKKLILGWYKKLPTHLLGYESLVDDEDF